MKRIYVCGEYSADNVLDVLYNIGRGEAKCAELFSYGLAPFCPWADAVYAKLLLEYPLDKQAFYNASIAWLRVSDAVYVISGEGKGGGVDAEIKIANEIGIPVFRGFMSLLTWAGVIK